MSTSLIVDLVFINVLLLNNPEFSWICDLLYLLGRRTNTSSFGFSSSRPRKTFTQKIISEFPFPLPSFWLLSKGIPLCSCLEMGRVERGQPFGERAPFSRRGQYWGRNCWQTLGKISFSGPLEEGRDGGRLEGMVPSPQWDSRSGAPGHRLSVVGVREKWWMGSPSCFVRISSSFSMYLFASSA